MKPEKLLALQKEAVNNPTLLALLRVYERGEMPFEDWAHYAIMTLASHGSAMADRLADELKRSPVPPLVINRAEIEHS